MEIAGIGGDGSVGRVHMNAYVSNLDIQTRYSPYALRLCSKCLRAASPKAKLVWASKHHEPRGPMDSRLLFLGLATDLVGILWPSLLARAGFLWWSYAGSISLGVLVGVGLICTVIGIYHRGRISSGTAVLFGVASLFLGYLTLYSVWIAGLTYGDASLACLVGASIDPNSPKCEIAGRSLVVVWLFLASLVIPTVTFVGSWKMPKSDSTISSAALGFSVY